MTEQKLYRTIQNAMNVQVRVYSSPEQLYAEVREALQNALNVCVEAHDSVIWPQVEKVNDVHNQLISDMSTYDEKIAPLNEELEALKISWKWLEQIQDELRTVIEEAWSAEQAALRAKSAATVETATDSESSNTTEVNAAKLLTSNTSA